MALDEISIIDRFFRPLAGEGGFGLLDDAGAISPPPGADLVVTTDMIAVGVHFLTDDPPGTIGQKALRVNLSDLAAKAATPLCYLLSLGMGPEVGEQWVARFAAGLDTDQRRFGIKLIGGDTISARATTISITALGTVPTGKMVHRFGGKPGDLLYVSGVIGAARAGLAALKGERGIWPDLSQDDRNAFVQRYRLPEPRTALAPALMAFASAAIDISDGLVGDCDKLAAASGCSAMIDAARVPIPASLAKHANETLLASLFSGGDDYEILAAVPPRHDRAFKAAASASGVEATKIGALTQGAGPAEVHWRGASLALARRSYVHGLGLP